MFINTDKKSQADSEAVLSLEENRAIDDENSSSNKKYSMGGHLSPEKNIPQVRWFKGSRDRGMREDIAA